MYSCIHEGFFTAGSCTQTCDNIQAMSAGVRLNWNKYINGEQQ